MKFDVTAVQSSSNVSLFNIHYTISYHLYLLNA